MSTPDALHLMRVLAGQRIRVGEGSWVVKQTRVEQNRLQIELSGASYVTIELELPDSFDSHSGGHMAWLLAQIEDRLKSRES